MHAFLNRTKTPLRLRSGKGAAAQFVDLAPGEMPRLATTTQGPSAPSRTEVDDALAAKLLDTSHPSGKFLAELIARGDVEVVRPVAPPPEPQSDGARGRGK